MGGGGRGSFRPQELRRLEQIVKESLQGAQPEKRNVFISFVKEDLKDVNMLRAQAQKEDSDLEFRDWSVKEPFDSENAEYIRTQIRERIRQASVTVVYVSEHTAPSKWVDWEVRESMRLGKGVIAVHKGERPPGILPVAIGEFKIPVVRWEQARLTKAIERAAKKREPGPQG